MTGLRAGRFAGRIAAQRGKAVAIKSIIHVNQHIIRRNAKTGGNEPVISVKRGRRNTYAHAVTIDGPSSVIYSPDQPLRCGARVWIETNAFVTCWINSTGGAVNEDQRSHQGISPSQSQRADAQPEKLANPEASMATVILQEPAEAIEAPNVISKVAAL